MKRDERVVAREADVVLGFYIQLSFQRSHERLDECVSGNCCCHRWEYLAVSRLVGSAFEVAYREAEGLVSVVVGLGHVCLEEVFEVVLHRVSEGHTVEFRGAVEVQACIVGAVVVQGRRLLGLIGCP